MDTYAIYRITDGYPRGHATSLTAAVGSLAALVGRPADALHTEQACARPDGWIVKETATDRVVGGIALAPPAAAAVEAP